MREYLYSIVCMVAASGIAMLVVPKGVHDGLKKHVGLICSLCVVCVMITPVYDIVGGVRDFLGSGGWGIFDFSEDEKEALYEDYKDIYDKYVEGGYGDNIGEAVKDSIFKKFGIAGEEMRVLTEFEDKNGDGVREPCKITVVLSGEAIFRNPREIEDFICEVFKCECECAIE